MHRCRHLSLRQRLKRIHCRRERTDAIWTAQQRGQPALAAIGEVADRLVGGDGDRLLRDLRQRAARHAPRRGRAGTADARESRLHHRRRHQPQRRAFRPVAARGGEQHGDARDQGRQQADPASDPVRSCRDRQAFRRDPGVRRQGLADHRRLDAGSGSGISRRRGILPDPSRPARRRPVHQPPDAASRRLCDRAEPAHHRPRRRLSRRGRGLDPLLLFSRTVRPPQSRPGRHHHRSAPGRHRHHAQAVRPRRDRQEFRRRAGRDARAVRAERIVFRTGRDATASSGCWSGATAPSRWSFWSESRGTTFSACGAPRRPGSAPSCWR